MRRNEAVSSVTEDKEAYNEQHHENKPQLLLLLRRLTPSYGKNNWDSDAVKQHYTLNPIITIVSIIIRIRIVVFDFILIRITITVYIANIIAILLPIISTPKLNPKEPSVDDGLSKGSSGASFHGGMYACRSARMAWFRV